MSKINHCFLIFAIYRITIPPDTQHCFQHDSINKVRDIEWGMVVELSNRKDTQWKNDWRQEDKTLSFVIIKDQCNFIQDKGESTI